jgi:hypothetical protein
MNDRDVRDRVQGVHSLARLYRACCARGAELFPLFRVSARIAHG